MEKINCLGERISEHRQNNSMTQEELAARLGVTPQAVSKWERGQSYPDVWLLKDICMVLGCSADSLLGNQVQKINENGDEKSQKEIWTNLQNCLKPIELIFGKNLVQHFLDGSFAGYIVDIRKRLSREGILMPIVLVRDEMELKENEFMVLFYDNVIHSENMEEGFENPLLYMMNCLETAVRENYSDIINPDIVKNLTDNLEQTRPAIIKGIVPEKISYGMLTDILKAFMKKGNSIKYLEKIIEYSESILRLNRDITIDSLIEQVTQKIQSENNYYIYMANRSRS